MSDIESVRSVERCSSADEVTKRLLALIHRHDYQLVQENGQRRLTSVGLNPRTKGAEIFLGRLPRDCYEDELVPLLMSIGRVIELRLMMDFSGSTRGYAFASFETPRIARRACENLNGYEIRPGHKIGVVKSIDNCRLFLGGVPKDKTKTDFMIELGKMLDGITNVYVYPSIEDKALNRGFVFVEFKDHRSAAMARRKLIPGRVVLWDHEVAVDWADPEPGQDIDDEVMETVSALFVRNLSLATTEPEIRHIIQRLTGVQVMKIKKINHFAFLHYETRGQALRALDIMKQLREGETSEWELSWAKPIRKTERLQERWHCVKGNDDQRKPAVDEGRRGQESKNRRNNRCNNLQNETKNLRQNVVAGGGGGCEINSKYRNTRNDCMQTPDSVGNSSSIAATNMNDDINASQTIIPAVHAKISNFDAGSNIMVNEHLAMLPPAGKEYYNDLYYAFNDPNVIIRPGIDFQLAQCAKDLGELATKYFHANLRYCYWSTALGNGHFCKVILERNGCELMSYQGNAAPTVHEAIRLTVPNAYAGLQSLLMRTIEYI